MAILCNTTNLKATIIVLSDSNRQITNLVKYYIIIGLSNLKKERDYTIII